MCLPEYDQEPQMYQKGNRWTKHLDFIILDIIMTQISFVLAYMTRHGFENPYRNAMYLNCGMIIFLVGLLFSILQKNHKNILKRNHYEELKSVIKYMVVCTFSVMAYLFFTRSSTLASRLTVFYFCIYEIIFLFLVRSARKRYVLAQLNKAGKKKDVFLITRKKHVRTLVETLKSHSNGEINIRGIILGDDEYEEGEVIDCILAVAPISRATQYIQDKCVDEIMIYLPGEDDLVSQEQKDSLISMGITLHQVLSMIDDNRDCQKSLEYIAGCACLTNSIRIVPVGQMIFKRILDITVGIIGVICTGILTVIIGPFIYISDPGPIFYSQERIGKNGRRFRMYKFRSMYKDADQRKAELVKKMHMEDQIMFKMKNDPRILGSGHDGTKKGIGWFIRKTSIDEFPQFWNVLKGDLSVVGTRPPTPDEWERYEPHQRARMAIKPGITGLWQTSGRSNIKDFEEVVKLDMQYINTWTICTDIKIILRTVSVMMTGAGAE